MWINFIKSALRNLWKNKVYSILNIGGVAFSLAACLLIFLNVRFETSYDRFHPEADQLLRVATVNIKNGEITYSDAMSFNAVGPELKEELPEVLEYARAFKLFQGIPFKIGDQVYNETGALLADPAFLGLFNYPLVYGQADQVLEEPYTMVLTRAAAERYFGVENPVGQSLEVPNGRYQGLYQITGVVEDPPENTHLGFDILLSYSTFWSIGEELNWNSFNDYTYIRVKEGANLEELQAKIPELSKKWMGEESPLTFLLQPVVDIHLHSNMSYEAEVNGSSKTVYFLSLIGIFILIIAWINYLNISTARAATRAREVGVRKTVGATRGQMIAQFMAEAGLVNLIACLLAVVIVYWSLPYFNNAFDQPLTIPAGPEGFHPLNFWVLLAIFFVVGTIASGLYPAFVLSSYRPVNVLKGRLLNSQEGVSLRKLLVVTQFAISTGLIIGVFVVRQQLHYMTSREMGMDLEQVLAIKNQNINRDEVEANAERFRTFKQNLESQPWVDHVTKSSSIPAGGTSNIGSSSGGMWREGHVTEERLTYYVANIDEDFDETYGIEVIEGRTFSDQFTTDTGRVVVINEAALNRLGFDSPQQAVGSNLVINAQERRKYRILGVIRNFSRQSLKNSIEPTVYFNIQNNPGLYVSIRLNTDDMPMAVSEVQAAWDRAFTDRPFDYFFVDDQYNALYQADRQFSRLFNLFAVLAIIIACLGVYGLSTFTLLQRTKEVGIRKVLGASITNIVILFFKEFIQLVLFGFLIALPLGYYLMDNWLDSYAFRIGIPWWVFPVAMVLTLVIVLATIGFQTIRSASANPVKALRYE